MFRIDLIPFQQIGVKVSFNSQFIGPCFPEDIEMIPDHPHDHLVCLHQRELKISMGIPLGEQPFLKKGRNIVEQFIVMAVPDVDFPLPAEGNGPDREDNQACPPAGEIVGENPGHGFYYTQQ